MPVAHVQTTKTVNNTGATSITSGSMTTTAGHLLIAVCLGFGNYGSALSTVASVKLDGVTAFTNDFTIEAVTAGTDRQRVTFLSLPNAAAGAHTLTVAYTAGNVPTNQLIFFVEVSGALTTAAVDGAGAGSSGNSTAASSGAFTTTNSDDFWIAATTSLAANPATFVAGTSWTIPTNGTETNSSSNLCGAVEYWANPGATSGTGAFTLKTGEWVAGAIGYKSAGGVVTVTYPQLERGIRGLERGCAGGMA
jgi:hypothetical protein